ncbi:MAG: hypothetical protein AAGC43_03405 [Bacteroidota bacterium]
MLKEESRFYKWKLFFIRIRHGLFLMTLRSILARLGVDIGFYYWVLEASSIIKEPKIKGENQDFDFGFLNVEEIRTLRNIHFLDVDKLIGNLNNGLKIIGLKNTSGRIAAFMFIEYNSFTYRKKRFYLDKGEVYLSNMYTYQDFRGLNLAPFLRYKSYKLLEKEGVDKIYSITDYFNKSSQKFKKKLLAQNIHLYFAIVLFKRFHRTFKIKEYSYS